MGKRVLTSVIGGFFVIVATIIGGDLYNLLYLGIALIALYEMNRLNSKKFINIESLINYSFVVTLFFIKTNTLNYFNYLLYVFLLLMFILFVFKREFNFKNLTFNIFKGVYVTFFMYHMILLNGNKFVWLVYIIAFGTDTFAFFTGKLLGKYKLCPDVSPNKTIEGAIGGIIGCTTIAIIYFHFLGIKTYTLVIIFSICASLISILGDLTASKIKREFGVKDFGNFLPGHGGILDRFDSVLFIAPIVFYFVTYYI